jgi:hypothetical protein
MAVTIATCLGSSPSLAIKIGTAFASLPMREVVRE